MYQFSINWLIDWLIVFPCFFQIVSIFFLQGANVTFEIPALKYESLLATKEGAADEARAPMPGVIEKILVNPGQEVKPGDPVVVMIAMKMEVGNSGSPFHTRKNNPSLFLLDFLRSTSSKPRKLESSRRSHSKREPMCRKDRSWSITKMQGSIDRLIDWLIVFDISFLHEISLNEIFPVWLHSSC